MVGAYNPSTAKAETELLEMGVDPSLTSLVSSRFREETLSPKIQKNQNEIKKTNNNQSKLDSNGVTTTTGMSCGSTYIPHICTCVHMCVKT